MLKQLFAFLGYTPIVKAVPAVERVVEKIVNKRIAFIDGDQFNAKVVEAYDKYVKNTGTEAHIVTLDHNGGCAKLLKTFTGDEHCNKVFLRGYTAGKEVVDKFIAGYIQRAVHEGYTHISVISNDYDFIDIFRMAVEIDENARNVTFHMIIPDAKGRAVNAPAKIANIQVTKMGKKANVNVHVKEPGTGTSKGAIRRRNKRLAEEKAKLMVHSYYQPVLGV